LDSISIIVYDGACHIHTIGVVVIHSNAITASHKCTTMLEKRTEKCESLEEYFALGIVLE